ncbi:MAG: hypothetical protein IM566_04320 [Pseudanabaena sp. M152S2SP2A07QC]|nr:hypothetical protein [Pseudanabaena sp. M109S1SP2A07QC]MCA6546649.1 hypothetical protein [Pseudanabaena sp. M152S2SP2A07QC]
MNTIDLHEALCTKARAIILQKRPDTIYINQKYISRMVKVIEESLSLIDISKIIPKKLASLINACLGLMAEKGTNDAVKEVIEDAFLKLESTGLEPNEYD